MGKGVQPDKLYDISSYGNQIYLGFEALYSRRVDGNEVLLGRRSADLKEGHQHLEDHVWEKRTRIGAPLAFTLSVS